MRTPADVFLPCDAYFMHGRNEAPVAHGLAFLIPDDLETAGRLAVSAAALAALFARDSEKRGERDENRCLDAQA